MKNDSSLTPFVKSFIFFELIIFAVSVGLGDRIRRIPGIDFLTHNHFGVGGSGR